MGERLEKLMKIVKACIYQRYARSQSSLLFIKNSPSLIKEGDKGGGLS